MLNPVLKPDRQAYANIALKLINRHASVDCNVHVREKLLTCVRRWVNEHKPSWIPSVDSPYAHSDTLAEDRYTKPTEFPGEGIADE